MSTLSDNTNSDFLGAFHSLKPKAAARVITVYVEANDDIGFWRNILKSFENDQLRFEIQLPSNTSLATGKNQVLKHIQPSNLGTNLLACVDSDYDYLLPNHSDYGQVMAENDFIIQTYAYSIENLKCFAESLQTLCATSTSNDTVLIDIKAFLQHYSNIVFDLFIWNLAFYKTKEAHLFPLANFCELVKLNDEPIPAEYGVTALKNLKLRVAEKLQQLQSDYPEKLASLPLLKEELQALGLTKHNAYLFIQGHTIFDNVVLRLLKPICKTLKNTKLTQMKDLTQHPEERGNALSQYSKHVKNNSIEILLTNNTEFKQCFLYDKILSDISCSLGGN